MKKILIVLPMLLVFGLLCSDDTKDKVNNVLDDITGITNYGYYCGPNHTGTEEPINAMDACCQTHDECYSDADVPLEEYLQCKEGDKLDCDKALVACIKDISDTDLESFDDSDSGISAVDYESAMEKGFQTCIDSAE